MTKKDYELIANAVKPYSNPDLMSEIARNTTTLLVSGLARALETDNPRFDRKRFLAACGVED